MDDLKKYWSQRYLEERTGWDLGKPSTPLKTYFDQLTDRNIKILIPGAGNSYEAEYLFKNGFINVEVLDIANEPIAAFAKRNPHFPSNQLIENDFFSIQGQYDLIIEQTFFCSFPPTSTTREKYCKKMFNLLRPNGKLVGLWFDIPHIKDNMKKRPFGGTKKEYLEYLSPFFEILTFEKCHNSEASRVNKEFFGIFGKKKTVTTNG